MKINVNVANLKNNIKTFESINKKTDKLEAEIQQVLDTVNVIAYSSSIGRVKKSLSYIITELNFDQKNVILLENGLKTVVNLYDTCEVNICERGNSYFNSKNINHLDISGDMDGKFNSAIQKTDSDNKNNLLKKEKINAEISALKLLKWYIFYKLNIDCFNTGAISFASIFNIMKMFGKESILTVGTGGSLGKMLHLDGGGQIAVDQNGDIALQTYEGVGFTAGQEADWMVNLGIFPKSEYIKTVDDLAGFGVNIGVSSNVYAPVVSGDLVLAGEGNDMHFAGVQLGIGAGKAFEGHISMSGTRQITKKINVYDLIDEEINKLSQELK